MDRKDYVRQTIEQFITSSHEERLVQCTFGIEVETQSEAESSDDDWQIVFYHLDSEDYMDYDSYRNDLYDRAVDYIRDNSLSDILSHVSIWVISKHDYSPKYTWLKQKRWYESYQIRIDNNSQYLKKLRLSVIKEQVKAIENRAERLGFDITGGDFKVKLFNKYSLYFGETIDDQDELNSTLDYSIEEYVRDDIDESDYYHDIKDGYH